MKLFAIMLVGWLAVGELSANPLTELAYWIKYPKLAETKAKEELNFNALDEYLASKLPGNHDYEKDLALIKSDIDQLTGGAYSAASMVLDVSEFGTQCNNKMLSILGQLRIAKLTLGGQRRVENILRGGWWKGRNACDKLKFESSKQAPPTLTKFIDEFCPYCDEFRDADTKGTLPDEYIYNKLFKLAKGTQFETGLLEKSTYNRAYEELISGPCKTIGSSDQLVNTFHALFEAKRNHNHPDTNMEDYLRFDTLLLDLIWTTDTCKKIVLQGN